MNNEKPKELFPFWFGVILCFIVATIMTIIYPFNKPSHIKSIKDIWKDFGGFFNLELWKNGGYEK